MLLVFRQVICSSQWKAKYQVKEKGDKIQYVLYAISNFLELDLPFYQDQKDFEKEMESLLEPEPDEYTEYDPDLHVTLKGYSATECAWLWN